MEFGVIQSSPYYQTFHLTDHEGASIVVDLQASGSENAPEFHNGMARYLDFRRISSVLGNTFIHW